MDEAVTNRALLRMLAAALMAGCAGASAQALTDPTRPPPSLQAGAPGADDAPVQARTPRLQSVLVSRQSGGRHLAIIDGETVRLGESFRGARVTRIEQHEVELSRGNTRQVLKLQPGAAATVTGIERAKKE